MRKKIHPSFSFADVDAQGASKMGYHIKGKMYSAEETLNFILYENQENALAADNVGASLDGNQVTTKYRCEY